MKSGLSKRKKQRSMAKNRKHFINCVRITGKWRGKSKNITDIK